MISYFSPQVTAVSLINIDTSFKIICNIIGERTHINIICCELMCRKVRKVQVLCEICVYVSFAKVISVRIHC